MPFKGGVKEAAKMLSGLDLKQRQIVLEKIAQKDPQMAELLKKNMVTMEDLKYLTPQMIPKFLKNIKLNDLALTLRKYPDDLKSFFLNHVSSRIKEELLDVFNGPPQPISKVNECEENIMTVVRTMIEKGDLVLSPDDGEEYV